jgi:hydroxyacylglutathione hydrolase
LGICNCFLLHGTFGYAIVDTGLAKHGDTILKAIADEGLAPKQIKYILLTHAHKDHAGSAAQLRNVTGRKLFRTLSTPKSSRAVFISGR